MATNADVTGNTAGVLQNATDKISELSTDQLAALLQTLMGGNTVGDNLTALANNFAPTGDDTAAPGTQDISALQQALGTDLTYDFDAIKGIYDAATQQANLATQNSGAERSYYKMLGDAQNSALDAIRKGYSSAVANGATKGMQAANMLSTILGTTQEANEQATALATAKQQRANEYAGALAENAKQALAYSNDTQNGLATLSRQLYNDDIQKYTSLLGFKQQGNTDRAGIGSSLITALGNIAGNAATAGAGMVNNNQSAIAQLQAAIEAANAQKYAATNAKSENTNNNVNSGKVEYINHNLTS